MNNKSLTNTLQIPIIFEANQDNVEFQISTSQSNQYVVKNPKVSSFQSWLNISEAIGNNKLIIRSLTYKTPKVNNNETLLIADTFKKTNFLYEDNTRGQFVNSFINGFLIDESQLNSFLDIDAFYRYCTYCDTRFYTGINLANGFIVDNRDFYGVGRFSSGVISNTSSGNVISNFISIRGSYVFKSTNNVSNLIYVYNANQVFDPILTANNGYPINQARPADVDNINILPDGQYYIRIILFTTLGAVYNKNSLVQVTNIPKYLTDISGISKYIVDFNPFRVLSDTFTITRTNINFDIEFFVLLFDQARKFVTKIILLDQNTTITGSNYAYGILGCKYIGTELSFNENRRIIAQDSYSTVTFSSSRNNNVFDEIIIPDGYYSGITSINNSSSFNTILDIVNNDAAFQELGGLIELDPISKKVKISGFLFIDFVGDVGRVFGFPNIYELFIDKPTISPNSIDLFSDGRFANVNIIFSSLSSMGYIGETLSLISIPASGIFGNAINVQDIAYEKLLPKSTALSTLSFRLVDNKNLPIKLTDRVYLRFEINAYE